MQIALPALRHRVILTAEAEVEGHKVDDVAPGSDSFRGGAAAVSVLLERLADWVWSGVLELTLRLALLGCCRSCRC